MEELKYIIEDRTIAEILGVQNFSTKESAILELVKNAYDSGASKLELLFEPNNELHIIDNGCGMTADDIRKNWMHVGYSPKEYEFRDLKNNARVFAGSKGIGRFALSRLGADVSVYSKADGQNGIHWHTDWGRNTLEECGFSEEHGTTIIIRELRDRWTEKSISLLKSYLSRTYNSDLMSIFIVHDGIVEDVQKYFNDTKLGVNCLSYFDLDYDAEKMQLKYSIYSDEFTEEAKIYCPLKNLKNTEGSITLEDTLYSDDLEVEEQEFPSLLKGLGNFKARMFFSLKEASEVDMTKFLYKYKFLSERFQEGIVLYRNAFSISSYEGNKDWLELGKRSRKSPAAATHTTGSWRVRENQLAGFVKIDKKENKYLNDLSNRQGLEENVYYKIFIKILQRGIAEFESYRQDIIREIDKKNTPPPRKSTPYINKAVKSPKSLLSLDVKGAENLVKELEQVKKEREEGERQTKNTEERYKYDIRILNMLSTIGLRASSIAHEMHNERNNISESYDNIVSAMKEYGIWDIANASKNKRYAYKNIPDLLEKNKKVNSKIILFMDTMLSNIEKDQFKTKEIDVQKVLFGIKETWERDYSWIKVEIPSQAIFFFTAEDAVKVLIDNLILNSIQQNDSKNTLDISIEIQHLENRLFIVYKDNGGGLPKKYRSNPRKILDVHESSRKNGHGLGMWILNNTLAMSGGEVVDIPVGEGFEIQMFLGDKL